MAKDVVVENLSVIFGTSKQKVEALELIDAGKTPEEIRTLTGATVAVKNVSLEIKENELFVIAGLSGSGKSSLIRVLNLLNIPARGRVMIGGENILELDKKGLRELRRSDVSMVFQHFGLLSHRSVLRNVEYPLEIQGIAPEKAKEVAMEALKSVGLEGWEHQLPKHLSGGMKQRVGLARALTNDPELLLMDEPYSALDPLIRREMQNELLSLDDKVERTIVFITHDMNEAFRLGDRIALLKDAEIVQIGTPKEFFDNPANDYVSKFIADVDKTRILKVRNIMHKPQHVAHQDDTVEDTIVAIEKSGNDYCYVTKKDNTYLGFVSLEALTKSKAKTIMNLIEEDESWIMRNAFLKDAWAKLKDATFENIAVLDSRHRLRGELAFSNITEALG